LGIFEQILLSHYQICNFDAYLVLPALGYSWVFFKNKNQLLAFCFKLSAPPWVFFGIFKEHFSQ
jgi:hypothetical protein